MKGWSSVAMSADGTKMMVLTYAAGGGIYSSSDSGATWVRQPNSSSIYDIAMSADGTKVVGVAHNNSVYTSTDAGATWTQKSVTGSGPALLSIAMSADGTKLAAVAFNNFIYTSTDSGETWTQQTSAGSRKWWSIAMSADGSTLAAVGYDIYPYISTDSGATWSEQTALGQHATYSVAINGDGTKIITASADVYAQTNKVYVSSDSGAHWTEETGDVKGTYVAVSGDGTRFMAALQGGALYIKAPEGPATDTFDLATLTNSDNLDQAVSKAKLSITSSTCYTISDSTVGLRGVSGITNPDGVKLLGGIRFDLSCASAGGNAPMTVTLGSYIEDLSTLHVYKEKNGALTDITDQLTITNVDGETILEYTLVDGGDFDEDGAVNGVIVDPLYIGVDGDTTTTTTTDGTDTTATGSGDGLASTGTSTYLLAIAALGLIGGAVVLRKFA